MVDGRNVCMYSSRKGPEYCEDDVRSLVKQDIKTVCLGLRSSDESIEQFATEQLRVFDPKEAAPCLKEGLVTEQAFREGVLIGLRKTERGRVVAEVIKEPPTPVVRWRF